MELSENDKNLVKIASDFIAKNYQKGRHHVACALRCGDTDYLSLHLDTKGFDVCAEPIALSNALLDGRSEFTTIVSVLMRDSGDLSVIAPCGNCRQILYEYTPEIRVIVPNTNSPIAIPAKSLFPHPYE